MAEERLQHESAAMSGTLCIAACGNFSREITAAIAAEEWDDVTCVVFPTRCSGQQLTWDELRHLLHEECKQVLLLGSVCLKELAPPPEDLPPIQMVHLEQCFHLVAGQALVDEAISSGGYLMTPGWLEEWQGKLLEMGFTPDRAGEFFREFAKELVLLDTGITPGCGELLGKLGEMVRLPVRSIPVRLDYTRLFLSRLVLEWRMTCERTAAKERDRCHAGELADHLSAMDMLKRLAGTLHETETVAVIEELFTMLFAPTALHYLRVEHGQLLPVRQVPEEMHAALNGLDSDYSWTADGTGFLLRIRHGDETVGLIAVDRLAFPEYRERYLNMALAVTGVCGLAIENARNRKKLLEAEKMASLGMLVAGVAHEINTPLGVVLASASSLQEKSRQLARNFAERSMTQSDLQRYLDSAGTATGLICHNMERIARLTDNFRQIAVEGTSPEKQVFCLKKTLEDVIRSLGDRLPMDRITVTIQCDQHMEIESLADDWVTIFMNLITNSIKHGFKDAGQGSIDIVINRDCKRLYVDYYDNGAGMTHEAQTRIFDPFYTTDLTHGMGIGMHLVYNIITHRLGGSITCASQPDHGVHFHIEEPQ